MSLVPFPRLLEDADQAHYAVGAFTTFGMEYTRALIETAEKEQSPMIVMFGPVEAEYAGMERLATVVRAEIDRTNVPVAFHLDHGDTFEIVMKGITCGFNSVMFDGSRLPYGENVEITREIVRVAHAVGIAVEGELGVIGGAEGGREGGEEKQSLTDPEQALDFVNKTGVDALAVAIGTAHGLYRVKPRIDIERLKEIRKKVKVRLVLHGGSDTPEEKLVEAIQSGISKININSDLKAAFTRSLRSTLVATPDDIAFEKHVEVAVKVMQKVLIEKLRLFGSIGKAPLTR
ncbi:MAG: class II fructose-bisphosphate aldolase [Candidatus Atribacteria bacterium]|nr:class II fructose-bisphosphate aldolase [Candidatus Atribacteria bacterium]